MEHIVVGSQTKDWLIAVIEEAKSSIKLALHHINDDVIISALIAAAKRGVSVRYICQKPLLYPHPFDHQSQIEIHKKFKEAGVQISHLDPARYTIVHYKILIIDEV